MNQTTGGASAREDILKAFENSYPFSTLSGEAKREFLESLDSAISRAESAGYERGRQDAEPNHESRGRLIANTRAQAIRDCMAAADEMEMATGGGIIAKLNIFKRIASLLPKGAGETEKTKP